ncbi:hypothetical protein ACHQM5_008761 [Ranunculus cassubicifolius]
MWERVLTDKRLMEMGTTIVSRSALCRQGSETRDHLFLHCPIARRVWEELLAGSGQHGNSFQRVDVIIYKMNCNVLTPAGKRYWEMLPHAFWWGIWQTRNRAKFEGEEVVDWRVLQLILKLLWSWGLEFKELQSIRLDELVFDWERIMFL